MKDRSRALPAILRGIARVQKTFHFEIGGVRASGVPAILLGAAGIVLAAGAARALAKSADRLPETLGAARGLAETMNDRLRLKS